MSEKKEGLLKSTINATLLKLGMKEHVETPNKVKLADDKGTVLFDSDELAEGSIVFMESAEGRVELPDGEHKLEDGRIATVKEGNVVSVTPIQEAKEEPKKEEQSADADVQMALVEKVIELTNQKADAKVEDIKKAVAAELSKIPVVTPMAQPKVEAPVSLSKHDISLMSVPERVNSFVVNDLKSRGHYNVNLATTTSVTTTYAGEFALPYIGAALLSGETLANNNVTIRQNVGLAGVTVKNLGTIGAMADATCDFTPTGNVTLTERKLTPKDLEVNLKLCKQDFLDDWEAQSMGAGRLGKSLPPNFQSYLTSRVAAEVAANVETYLWQGTDVATQFEGIEAKLTTTEDLTGGAVSTSNVLSKIRIITAAIPNALQLRPTVKLYCATDIVRAYKQLQGDNGYLDVYQTAANIPMMVDGYEMIWAPGMTSGSIIAAESSNIWFGTDLVSDHSAVRIIDQENIDGSDNVHFVMKFTAGTQVGVVGDCVHGVQAA